VPSERCSIEECRKNIVDGRVVSSDVSESYSAFAFRIKHQKKILLRVFGSADEGIMIFRNVGKYQPKGTSLHPATSEPSATQLLDTRATYYVKFRENSSVKREILYF
jgi:hypothetical protein